jgi:hypothetical protein
MGRTRSSMTTKIHHRKRCDRLMLTFGELEHDQPATPPIVRPII